MFIVAVAIFFTLMIAIGGGIIYFFSPPSHGEALSNSEQFVPLQNTRDWGAPFLQTNFDSARVQVTQCADVSAAGGRKQSARTGAHPESAHSALDGDKRSVQRPRPGKTRSPLGCSVPNFDRGASRVNAQAQRARAGARADRSRLAARKKAK